MQSREEIKRTISNATTIVGQTDPQAAALMQAVKQSAGREVVRCMDPRHRVSIDEAYAAVYDTPPFDALLAFANAVCDRAGIER